MIRSAWRYLSGYVIIKVKGSNLERFLNRLARAGVPVWKTQRVASHMLVARVGLSGFRKVRALSRGQRWKVSISEKVGLPFVITSVLRRKALLAGAFLFLIGLFAASNFIWFVRIEGDVAGLEDEIMAVVSKGGLRPGIPIGSVDREGLQRSLLLEVDELAWAAVNVKGTVAVVEVAERSVIESGRETAGNVVAARDGIVEHVTAVRGQPLVEPGDTVRAGDILISGFIPPDSDEHRQLLEEGRAPYVRADGVVRGRTWYEGIGRAYLVSYRDTPTGARASAYVLRIGDRSWRIGSGERPFTEQTVSRSGWETDLFGRALAVERIVYTEVEREREEIGEAQAVKQAQTAALIDLQERLPDDAEVVDGPHVEVEVNVDAQRPVIVARAWAEVVAMLGRFEAIDF